MKSGSEKSKSKLTPRQSRFVDEYMVDLNGTQAAIRAGYSKKTADSQSARLLVNVKVQGTIQGRMNRRSDRTEITSDFILNGIRKNIERCEQAAPVLDREGNPVMTANEDGELAAAYKYDATNVFKGYELLGRHLKLFTDKHEHTGPNGGPIQTITKNMTPQEAAAAYADTLNSNKS
jgi:phage terminase small subunit